MTWNDLTVKQYREIEGIMQIEHDDFEKLAFAVCCLYGMTPDEVNKIMPRKYVRLTKQIEKLFSIKPEGEPCEYIGKYKINYNVGSLRFANFVEIQHFAQLPFNYHYNYILASCVAGNDSTKHKEISDYFLDCSFIDCFFSAKKLIDNIIVLNKKFTPQVQEEDEQEKIEEDEQPKQDFGNGFEKKWGWIYSVTRIAKHRRITLDQAYELTTIQALNDLSFIRDLQKHEQQLIKNANK